MLIRDAELNDSDDIFEWRNDPLSCAMSISEEIITHTVHEIWYRNSLKNPQKKLYIGISSGEKIGICRFDFDELDNISEVSINLNPKMRGKNLSQQFLASSILKYRLYNCVELKAKIRKENKASLKIFVKCGFTQISEDSSFYFLVTQ